MRGEDLAEVREEARIALTQIERLSGVVDHLLDSARQSRSATALPIDVDAVVHQQVQEWAPAFDGVGRTVVVAGERRLRALATPGGIAQVLATLLENSLVHGAGTVTVTVRRTATWVVLEVLDEGAGVPAHLGSRIFERAVSGATGTGLGLSLARDLAEADGGRLDLLRLRPPVFALFLREPGRGGAAGSAAGGAAGGADDGKNAGAADDAGARLSLPGAPGMPAAPGNPGPG
jgi:signal transduction histidine kinase